MIAKKIGKIICETINRIHNKMKFCPQKQTCGNENTKQKFYAIRRNDEKAGLCSYLITILGYMNYKSPFLEEEFGKVNAWDLGRYGEVQ